MPSCTQVGKDLTKKAKQADIEEYKVERAFEKRQQYKHFVPTFQIDAHLVGRFLKTLGNNAVCYGFFGKSQSNPKARKDGSAYPSQSKPTNIFMTHKAKHVMIHTWVLYQCGVSVPRDHHCHHIDGDVTNNMRENLEVLSNVEHGRITMQEQKGTIDYKANAACKGTD